MFNYGHAQPVSPKDTNQRLYLCMSNMPANFSKNIKSAKIPNCIYFSTNYIDPLNTLKIDKIAFKTQLNKQVPDLNYKGILVLDWENEIFDTLREGKPNTQIWDEGVSNFIEAIKYAKKLRPKAQWGYWNIPLAIYFVKLDTLWSKRIDATEKLIQECDILMPSLYDVYPTGAVSWQDDTAFIKQNLLKTLAIASKYDKPVLPFVWHRYSDAVKESGLTSIEPKEFANQLALMKSVSYKGKKINGVIWWQEDLYFINVKSANIMKEMKGRSNERYRDDVLSQYFRILKKLFK